MVNFREGICCLPREPPHSVLHRLRYLSVKTSKFKVLFTHSRRWGWPARIHMLNFGDTYAHSGGVNYDKVVHFLTSNMMLLLSVSKYQHDYFGVEEDKTISLM